MVPEKAIPDDVWIIVPAFDEANAIGEVIADLRRYAKNIVVVDDGSLDLTSTVARKAGATVLRHIVNRGQGAAIQTGIEYALLQGAKAVVTFDSDGQHAADDIPSLLAPIHEGRADVVLGSRFLGGEQSVPALRRLLLRGAVWFTRLTSGLPVTDAHNGLRAFSRRAAETIHIQLDRMAHASEIMDQIRENRLRYLEMPVRVRYTAYAHGKGQRGFHAFRVVFDYLVGRWVR